MTTADRSIVFFVSSLLAAATMGSAGVLEDNKAFSDQIFEKEAIQIRNSIDLMSYTVEGEFQKRFEKETDINIHSTGYPPDIGDEITVDRSNRKSFTLPILDAHPSTVNIQNAEYICVETVSPGPGTAPLNVSKGQC